MTRTEQRSGNPVYVKWEQRQFIPGWSLRLLSPQITDCHEHPANKPVLGGGHSLRCIPVLSICSPSCRCWGHTSGGGFWKQKRSLAATSHWEHQALNDTHPTGGSAGFVRLIQARWANLPFFLFFFFPDALWRQAAGRHRQHTDSPLPIREQVTSHQVMPWHVSVKTTWGAIMPQKLTMQKDIFLIHSVASTDTSEEWIKGFQQWGGEEVREQAANW